MPSFTKWIGGGLGFVLGGPIGALVGFGIGGVIDAGINGYNNGTKDEEEYRQKQEGDFRISLLVLIACVMKADGVVQKTELEVVKRFLSKNFDEESSLQALIILKGLLQQNMNEAAMADQISENMNYSSKLELVHFLLDIAYADGEMLQTEFIVIQRISNGLGVSSLDFQSLQASYNKTQNTNWAFDVLEIKPDAISDEIKKAYRTIAMKFHPDKVQSLGDDVKQKATEKFRSVNEAYNYLTKMKDIK